MGRTEPPLPFGKHKGEKISKLAKTHFQYVLWLSGRHLEWSKDRTWNVVEQAAKSIGTAAKYKKCFCDSNPVHDVSCMGYFAGATVGETAKNIVDKVEEFNSPNHAYAKTWIVVNKNHHMFTKGAAEYIDKHHLCWSCGKKTKQNTSGDWPVHAYFHKKCFKAHQ